MHKNNGENKVNQTQTKVLWYSRNYNEPNSIKKP